MKKLRLILSAIVILACIFTAPVLAGENSWTYHTLMAGDTAIAAGHAYSATTTVITITPQDVGYFGTQFSVLGDGTGKLYYQASYDGTNYVEPEGGGIVFSGITSASGTQYTQFGPHFSKYIKFIIEETGDANAITPTCYLLVK